MDRATCRCGASLFRSLNRDTAQIRIQALSDYLKKMQK